MSGKRTSLTKLNSISGCCQQKKSAKQAPKKTILNTVKKKTGGSLALRVRRRERVSWRWSKRSGSKIRKSTNMRKAVISKNKQPKRSGSG